MALPASTPAKQVITPENAAQLTQIGMLGQGGIGNIQLSPAGDLLVVPGSLGVRLYDMHNLSVPPRLLPTDEVTYEAAFNPQGTLLAASTLNGIVYLWNLPSGERTSLQVGIGVIGQVTFSPDGKRLLVGQNFGPLQVWDMSTRQRIGTIGMNMEAPWGVMSHDGKLAAITGFTDDVPVWDANDLTQHLTLVGHTSYVFAAAFSPDDTQIATADRDATIRLWDAATGVLQGILQSNTDNQPEYEFLAYSPDGKTLVSFEIYVGGGSTRLWDPATRRERFAVKTRVCYRGGCKAAFSTDNQMLAVCGNGSIQVVRAATGETLLTLPDFRMGALAMFITPDGKSLVVQSEDDIQIWDIRHSLRLQTIDGFNSIVNSLAFRPDGKVLASAGGNGLAFWDITSQNPLPRLSPPSSYPSNVRSITFSPDGKLVAFNSYSAIQIWDVAAHQKIAQTPVQIPSNEESNIVFQPDGRSLWFAAWDGSIRCWDFKGNKVFRRFKGRIQQPITVAVSADGKILASLGFESRVELWDTETAALLDTLDLADDPVVLAFSPTEPLLAVQYAQATVDLWNLNTYQRRTLDSARRSDIDDAAIIDMGPRIAFSHDGRLLATGNRDHTVRLWDVTTGQPLDILKGHTNSVISVMFSPDGSLLATAGWDGTIRLWGIP